jgi:hypothetical protein
MYSRIAIRTSGMSRATSGRSSRNGRPPRALAQRQLLIQCGTQESIRPYCQGARLSRALLRAREEPRSNVLEYIGFDDRRHGSRSTIGSDIPARSEVKWHRQSSNIAVPATGKPAPNEATARASMARSFLQFTPLLQPYCDHLGIEYRRYT